MQQSNDCVLFRPERACESLRHVSAPTNMHIPGVATAPRPWHANIMNGPANEGLLIDYGENRVLLTQWWQLRGVLGHFVNALFFQPVQPRGSLYRPSDQRGHLAWDEVYYLCNISLSPYIRSRKQSVAFFPPCVHVFINIQRMDVSYVLLQAYTKPNQVCLPVMRVNGDFKALYSKLLFNEAHRSC